LHLRGVRPRKSSSGWMETRKKTERRKNMKKQKKTETEKNI
jgi:hypothetical protein